MKELIEASRKIGFRNARPTDLPEIMRIEYTCFSSVICESEAVYAERIRIFSEGFRVVTDNQKVIGFLSTELWPYKEDRWEQDFKLGHSIEKMHCTNGTELYISSMGLDPQYRGAGLGRRLFCETMSYMGERYPQIQSAVLIVSEAWTGARRIYREEGFIEIKRIEGFFVYPTDVPYAEDGIVMRKKYADYNFTKELGAG